jgi:adenosylmethionine-8-amino-7-oxononanoate aminotransferase
MLVFAKGVTSGYQPLGGVAVHERVWRVFEDAGPDFTLHQGFTYSGHPVACAAGLANLDVIEREGLVEKVRRDGPYLAERLATLAELPIVGEIRSIGLMAAIEIVADRAARKPFPPAQAVPARIRDAARRRGLICRANAEALMLCPPLVTTRQQIDEIVGIVHASIADVATFLG